jgi:5-oxoprolinase (ATP-hydrolysing)
MQEQDSVSAIDYLDDGTPIALTVHIDRSKGSAVFDFTGTGVEIYVYKYTFIYVYRYCL